MYARTLQALVRGGTIRLSQRRSTTAIEVRFVGNNDTIKPESRSRHQYHQQIAMQLQRIVRGKQGRDKARAQAEVVVIKKAERLGHSSRFVLYTTQNHTC